MWLGKISDECVSMLKGLFDIRPSHRFGGRNIDALKSHSWMQAYGLTDWDFLLQKKTTSIPHFIPGASLLRRKSCQRGQNLKHRKKYEKISTSISNSQQSQFQKFHYITPEFSHYFTRHEDE